MTWTKERHEAVKARCEAATPGEWYSAIHDNDDGSMTLQVSRDGEDGWIYGIAVSQAPSPFNDHEFIAHARQDLPDALKEIEILQMDLRHVREFLPRLYELARDNFEESEYPDTGEGSEYLEDLNTIYCAKGWLGSVQEKSE